MGPEIRVGDFRCFLLDGGSFRVDGGAMFGGVPRALWEKRVRPDGQNRVPLAMHPLLILGLGHKVLVDPGIGLREYRRFGAHFAIPEVPDLEGRLAEHGVAPGDLDLVILSHLHWDHAGAGLAPGVAGSPVPAFPRAAYLVQRGEWESARETDELTRESYALQAEVSLVQSGRLELVQGEAEIIPGLHLLPTPGHTPFHQSVLIASRGESLLYLGDLIPTRAHLPLPWITSLDREPALTLRTKRRVLRTARDRGWRLAFCHEPGPAVSGAEAPDPA